MNILNILIEQPILNALVAFYHGLLFLHIPYALGFAIILLTVFIRALMYPITASQLKMQKKMQELAPHLAEIKNKHKGDMKLQQEATMALYKEHNINPLGGCLPGVVQIVILLFGLYPALTKVIALSPKDTVKVINNFMYTPMLHLTKPWDTHFFGIALSKTPTSLLGPLGISWLTNPILLIPITTAVLQFIQSKMMAPALDAEEKIEKKEKGEPDFATTFQKQSMYLLPIMIGFFSFRFSIGLSLYWNTFTLFGIIQQYLISGWGGLSSLMPKK